MALSKIVCTTFVVIILASALSLPTELDAKNSSLEIVKYSDNHGPKAELSENDTYARRYEGYCWAVCLTEQPLKVGETLHFNITERETGWMSNMDIGVSYKDPEYISPGDLVICDDNVTTTLPYTEVFIFKRFYSEDNVYRFHVDKNGTAYLSPSVTYNDVIFTDVNVTRPFWVIFNIFGNTKAIKLLGKTPPIDDWTWPFG